MDAKPLLNSLVNLFRNERSNGLYVDQVGLAPAYDGMVKEAYILAVSAPTSANTYSGGDRADKIIDLLFAKLHKNERSMIDRVRVYDSSEELERYARYNFGEQFTDYLAVAQAHKSIMEAVV